MEFSPDALTDWIQLGFTMIGGAYALYLLKQSNKDRKNQYISDILNRLYNDIEVRLIIYSVDSRENVDEIKFRGKLEKEADKTLHYFNYIGYLIKQRKLKLKDTKPFEYEINRVLDNKEVCAYIKWLRNIGVRLEYLHYLNSKRQ